MQFPKQIEKVNDLNKFSSVKWPPMSPDLTPLDVRKLKYFVFNVQGYNFLNCIERHSTYVENMRQRILDT